MKEDRNIWSLRPRFDHNAAPAPILLANKIFEFDGTLDGGPCQMMITSVLGHLMEHDFDEQRRRMAEPIEAAVHRFARGRKDGSRRRRFLAPRRVRNNLL